jgi:tetratricopeptide (TPR) repeat protein/predicted Ser/Thr protein kinase
MTMDMTPARWAALKRVLEQLLALHPEQREAFLNRCDDSVRHDLTLLLAADDRLLAALEPTVVGGTLIAPEVLAGRYRIEKSLGRGGMGEVDLARDLLLNRPVAVKRLREPGLDAAHAMRRLVSEGRALAALDHPNIARVQDVLEGSPPALVMEFVEGSTLEAWLDEPRAPALVLEILQQIVRAIAYAHDHGVVHCDIKPRNVIVTADSEAKVIDFGIALVWSAVETVTSDSTRVKMYTPRYAAPEVIRGATPTRASDVFSLGVLIDDVVKACREHGEVMPEPLVASLARVSKQAQAQEAAARPRDAKALAALLPDTIQQARSMARWRMMATTTLVVCASCVAGGVALVGDKVAASSPLPIIAVIPRVDADAAATVSAGAADLLREGLEPLTRARLAKGDVPSFEGSLPDLVNRLRDQGLSHVVIPTVAPFGSGVRMSAVIYRATDGAILTTFTRHGQREARDALVREVASLVRAWLGEPSAVLPEVTTTFQPTSEAFELYSQARHYSGRPDQPGSLATARSLLEKVVQLEPGYAAAHAEIGRVLLLQYLESPAPELVIMAQNALSEAQRVGGDDEDVLLGLAMAKQMTGRRDEAVSYLHQALNQNQQSDRALRMLGTIEVGRGRADSGLELLRKAAQIRPSFVNYRALGTALHEEGHYPEALTAFERLAVYQPDNPWSFQMIGATYQLMGEDEKALDAYERSINVRRTASTLTNFATFLYSRGDLEQAEQRYAEAVALEPHDPVMYRNLGDAQLQRGRVEAARETFGRALAAADALLKINAGDARAVGNAAYAAARRGQCEIAFGHAGRLETIAPTLVTALANRANVYALCGRHVQSVEILKGLKARGRAPSAVLEKDVWQSVEGLPEYRSLVAP